MIKKIKNVKKYQIYIGMKDREKLEELCSTDEFIKIVSEICSEYKISFSMREVYGGYIRFNGDFISEKSLILSIIGLSKKEIFNLCEELKIKLNQETIMVSLERPKLFLIK